MEDHRRVQFCFRVGYPVKTPKYTLTKKDQRKRSLLSCSVKACCWDWGEAVGTFSIFSNYTACTAKSHSQGWYLNTGNKSETKHRHRGLDSFAKPTISYKSFWHIHLSLLFHADHQYTSSVFHLCTGLHGSTTGFFGQDVNSTYACGSLQRHACTCTYTNAGTP